MYYTMGMAPRLIWDAETATYVRSRGQRYSNAQSLEPEWAQEAMQDPQLVALEPDPTSRMGASRFMGSRGQLPGCSQ